MDPVLTAASNTSTFMPALFRPMAQSKPQMPPPTMEMENLVLSLDILNEAEDQGVLVNSEV